MRAFRQAELGGDRPTAIFAYTIKGWRLPMAADPFNHSALLSAARLEALREALHIDAGEPWAGFPRRARKGSGACAPARRLGLRESDAAG